MKLTPSSSLLIATLASSSSLSALAAPTDADTGSQTPSLDDIFKGSSDLVGRDNPTDLVTGILRPIICPLLFPHGGCPLDPPHSAAVSSAQSGSEFDSHPDFAVLDVVGTPSSSLNATDPTSSASPSSSLSAEAASTPTPPAPSTGGSPGNTIGNIINGLPVDLPVAVPPLPALPVPLPALPGLPALPVPLPALPVPLPALPGFPASVLSSPMAMDVPPNTPVQPSDSSAAPPGATPPAQSSPNGQPPLLPNASAQDYASFSSAFAPDATPSANASSSAYPSYPTSSA